MAGKRKRGYVESDGYNDTHGFERSGKWVWVEFRPGGWNDRSNVKKRSVWLDHLGDWYVLGSEGEHFERLSYGDAIIDWDWVEEGSDGMIERARRCMECGKLMDNGMTNLSTVYVHEGCFKLWMDENCPDGWREVADDGCDGYYEELVDGEWVGTGIFYTEWD